MGLLLILDTIRASLVDFRSVEGRTRNDDRTQDCRMKKVVGQRYQYAHFLNEEKPLMHLDFNILYCSRFTWAPVFVVLVPVMNLINWLIGWGRRVLLTPWPLMRMAACVRRRCRNRAAEIHLLSVCPASLNHLKRGLTWTDTFRYTPWSPRYRRPMAEPVRRCGGGDKLCAEWWMR